VGAKYLSVQLANGGIGSLGGLHHTATLNLSQVRPNADGTITFAIAPKDPGLFNWLDTTGLHQGVMFVRWQKLAAAVTANDEPVRSVQLVKATVLDPALPRITPADRERQWADRAKDYARRFTD
jgi:hypothetical protein